MGELLKKARVKGVHGEMLNNRRGHSSKEKSGFLEILVIVILLSSVFIFGAVQEVVLAAEEFLIIAGFMVLLIGRVKKGEAIEKTPLFLPFTVFLVVMLAQVIPLPLSVIGFISPKTAALRQELGRMSYINTISLVPARTLHHFVRWVTIFLIYILAVNVFTKKNLSKLLNSLFALSLVEAFYGLYLSFTGSNCLLWYCKPEYGNFGHRVHGTYRNPDHLAGYLEMVIPIHIAQVISRRLPTPFRSEEKAQKFLGIFLIMIVFVTLVLTVSRAGIIASLVGMTYFWFSSKREEAVSKYMFYLKIFIALILIYLIWIGLGPVIDRFWVLSASLQHGRSLVWKDTMGIVRDFPIFGTGFGTFQFIFTHYKTFPEQVFYDYAHNDYLQFLAEGGFVGLLSFLWLVFRGLKMLFKGNSSISRGAAAGFIAILVHSFFDFNLHIPANAYIFSIILAVGWIGRVGNNDRHPLPSPAEH